MTERLPDEEALLRALHDVTPKAQALQQRRANIPNIRDIRDVERWASENKAMITEMIFDTYAPIMRAADALLLATTNERTRALVGKVAELTMAQVADLRDSITQLEAVSNLIEALAWIARWIGAIFGVAVRRQQMDALTKELEEHFAA